MILVDTSVWVGHLRENSQVLASLLDSGMVLIHPFVLGELAPQPNKSKNHSGAAEIVLHDQYRHPVDSCRYDKSRRTILMIKVDKDHFLRAALEIGRSGENDTLPYDVDAAFIKEQSEELAEICITLFRDVESGKVGKPLSFMNSLTIASERILVPSGSHGFRITAKIHPFWNLYLNGLGLAIADSNEANRSARVHSYRLSSDQSEFFDRARSWRSYKEATLTEDALADDQAVVVQTDIASFYEHIYHHRLENIVKDLAAGGSTIALQIDRILNKLAAGRSFGLPVGGQCARVLAEVMMTPIDQSLSDTGLLWHRYVDDFTLICRSQQDAYKALSVLSHALADYGLSLNRSKTTFLSAKHYREFISTQLGIGDESVSALREMDLHFDPYSDNATEEYERLKQSFDQIDISLLLELELGKSQPDAFVLAQIGRALKFQNQKMAEQLCATLLDPKNLDSFRGSWSKIMRGVFAVRSRSDFEAIFTPLDVLLDRIPSAASHLLVPEANLLHFLRVIRFVRTEARGSFVRRTYDSTSSSAVRRACIECWRYWRDRPNFIRVRNQWDNLAPNEQRMVWLAASAFSDEGAKARDQLRASLAQSWKLGFETERSLNFSTCYENWARSAT